MLPETGGLWKDVSAGAGAAQGHSLAQLFRTDSFYFFKFIGAISIQTLTLV